MAERRRTIQWTLAAAGDLVSIADYAAKESPTRASRLLSTLRARADSLAHAPERGRRVPELRALGVVEIEPVRELVVRPYRLLYRIGDDAVTILAVVDSRRDLESLIVERSIRRDRG